MKSIRVSLIVYLLILLAVALGTASVLVYHNAIENLQAKQKADRQLEDMQYDQREKAAKKEFDDKLITFASQASTTVRYQWDREAVSILHLLSLGLMTETNAHAVAPLWFLANYTDDRRPVWQVPLGQNSLGHRIALYLSHDIPLEPSTSDENLPHPPGEQVQYQINSSWGPRWVSTSLLGKHGLDPSIGQIFDLQVNIPKHDDISVNETTYRRVMVKYEPPRGRARLVPRILPPDVRLPGLSNIGNRPPGGRRGGPDFRGPPGQRGNPGSRAGPGGPGRNQGGPGRGPGGRGPGGPPPEAAPAWLVVQCVMEPAQLQNKLAELTQEHEEILQKLDTEAAAALAALRRQLLWLGLCTFLGTTLGGSLLITLGLAPLRRLSDAVSRVTHKDFRLPLASDARLPKELNPIRERLQETLDELRKAFEREKQASADISHELRTPVASLLTCVEVALKKPRSPDEYRQTLEDCRVTARQMRQLVERIMALSRLDAGTDHIRPREVDVNRLVSECATLVRPLAGERGLELRVHCPKPVTWTTDPDKLREVVINLLHNAVQYNRPAGAIDLSAQTDDGWLDVQVHDTGVGIAPEAREHIFERFFRSDSSRTDSELHAGLGLSIVKGYVGLLGGTITVDSKPGHGSTFRVRLPATGQAA